MFCEYNIKVVYKKLFSSYTGTVIDMRNSRVMAINRHGDYDGRFYT